jgi:imidazolonepropionase-like amidohydrolase
VYGFDLEFVLSPAMAPGIVTNGWHAQVVSSTSPGQPLNAHDQLRFDPKLKPKPYDMAGTSSDSKILFLDVNILDSTGREPYRGDVLIHGKRIVAVGVVRNADEIRRDSKVRVVQGHGRTLMSGLGDAHTHFTWNNNSLELLGDVGVEEHTLITARSALTYLDSGYTMCYGAAAAKDRLDCVIRDAINRAELPGPRLLANGKEIAKRDAELASGITVFADGPLEMRDVIRHHAKLGVDQIKLSMSGEAILESRSAEESFFADEETAACVDEAHRLGLRVCSHARARDSVIQCVRYGVDVIYHASYTDEEGMALLEKNKHKHVVAPAINWLYTTVHEAAPFGYTFEQAEKVGYKKELEVAVRALKEMHLRGITVLPGGDYGFAWCPHGTYARDLEHFVNLIGFTPMESIIAATAGIAKLFMREDELGKILPGFYADCILVNGDPLTNIAVLQDHSKLDVILINGRIHKARPTEFSTLSSQSLSSPLQEKTYYNYVAYEDDLGRPHIGHLDFAESIIHPLTMASGSPLSSLNEVIELGDDGVARGTGSSVALSSVKLLPPLADRDVVCIGANYHKHVKEYRESGYAATEDPAECKSPEPSK